MERKTCFRCDGPPPAWVTNAGSEKEERQGAAGERSPKTITVGDFILAGGTKKARKQAKRLAAQQRELAELRDKVSKGPCTAASPDEPAIVGADVDMDTSNDDSATLQQKLDSAQKRVQELESVGSVAQATIPEFDKILEAARENRNRLVQERRASRPVQWRLVAAEQQAKEKAARVSTCRKDLAALRGEHETLTAKISQMEIDLQKSMAELCQADGAVAAVRDEIARESRLVGKPPPAGDVSDCVVGAVATVQGLAQQINALPAAVATHNAPDAVRAIQAQLQAVLASFTHIASLSPDVEQMVPPPLFGSGDSACTVRRGSVSGRRGTSPRSIADSGASDSDDDRSRSRERKLADRARDAAATAAVDASRRLEDMGFFSVPKSDPYMLDTGPGMVGDGAPAPGIEPTAQAPSLG